MIDREPTPVPATELRVRLGEIFRRVRKGEHIMVEKGGTPIAVLLDVGDYEDLRSRAGHRRRATPLSKPAPDGRERLLRSFGGWKGVDVEKFKADIKASRKISTRPPVELP